MIHTPHWKEGTGDRPENSAEIAKTSISSQIRADISVQKIPILLLRVLKKIRAKIVGILPRTASKMREGRTRTTTPASFCCDGSGSYSYFFNNRMGI